MRGLRLLEVARVQQDDLAQRAVTRDQDERHALARAEVEPAAAKRVDERAPLRTEQPAPASNSPSERSPAGWFFVGGRVDMEVRRSGTPGERTRTALYLAAPATGNR